MEKDKKNKEELLGGKDSRTIEDSVSENKDYQSYGGQDDPFIQYICNHLFDEDDD